LYESFPPLFDNSHFSLVKDESFELVKEKTSVLQEDRIVSKTTVYSPGMYKIFEAIVTNATDNKHRHPNTMDRLDIEINPDTGKGQY
jgi:hypothetical protein